MMALAAALGVIAFALFCWAWYQLGKDWLW